MAKAPDFARRRQIGCVEVHDNFVRHDRYERADGRDARRAERKYES
jgi:hypothetical protein